MASASNKKEKEVFAELEALYARDKEYISNWLKEIERDGAIDNKVPNPLTGVGISIISKGGIYPLIIKWCEIKYPNYVFTNIPNYGNISAGPATAATASPNGAKVAKSKSPDIDIILIAENWKKNPTTDPFTGETIDISIDPKSKYVILYQKIINKLVKHILETKPRVRDVLTVDDCKYIQSCLPFGKYSHAYAPNLNIFYDYLFIKYFIHSKTFNYNTHFTSNIYIHIYKIIYLSHTTYRGETLDELLMNFGVNIGTSQLSLVRLIMNLCSDIRNVLYMHESKITENAINTVIENKATLLYCKPLFDLSYINTDFRAEILNYLNGERMAELQRFNNGPRDNENHYIYYIYSQIAEHMKKDNDIYHTLISICDCILKLYRDNNSKNTIYKYIKDPYNVDIKIDPQMPRKPTFQQKLQLYKMRLNNLNNDVDAAKKAVEEARKEEMYDRVEKEKNIKRKEEDLEKIEKKLEEFEIDNEPNKIDLRNYEKDMEDWQKELKIYERKKDNYDNLPLYEKKKKEKNPFLKGKFKSDDNIAIPPRVSLVKYSDKMKAFTSVSNMSKQPPHNVPEDYYVNIKDPYTTEVFKEMHPNKQRYVSDILFTSTKDFHYRFDTVIIYNYILRCIESCTKPINYYTNTEFTDENLDEICIKIKHFTKSPTYLSSFDIKRELDNCKYDNNLVIDYVVEDKYDYTKEIVGHVHAYLHIKLGGILFRVINKINPVLGHGTITTYDNIPNLANPLNSHVISLPFFNTNPIHNGMNIYTAYPSTLHTFPEDLIYELNTMLSKGELIGNKLYPNRKNNNDGQRWKTIMNLPKFVYSLNDTAKETLDNLKKYQEKIQRQ